MRPVSGVRAFHAARQASTLERFPITWNHVIDKESLKFKDLEHVKLEKVAQFFRDMLYAKARSRGQSAAASISQASRDAPPAAVPAPASLMTVRTVAMQRPQLRLQPRYL